MKKRSLIRDGILLIVLTIVIILLILLFNAITYGKSSSESNGLPSFGLWKQAVETNSQSNLSENNSAIENPSSTEIVKTTFKQYWLSYVVLFLIVVLLIAWVLVVFKVYNG